MPSRRFRELLQDAVTHFSETGYESAADLQDWLLRLGAELDRELPSDDEIRRNLATLLTARHGRAVASRNIERIVPGVEAYTIERLAPEMRAELDRHIFAGVDLIKLNRDRVRDQTLQRFSGWVSSVPPGGTHTTDRRKLTSEISKPLLRTKWESRRVAIDQGAKLSAAVERVAAMGNGAIAGIWYDRGQNDKGYDARPEHLRRSGSLFFIRGSWALDEGLIAKGGLRYTDEIEQPAELPFCSCAYQYVMTPSDIPEAMLTAKGREWIATGIGAV